MHRRLTQANHTEVCLMRKLTLALMGCSLAVPALAGAAESPSQLFTDGKAYLDLRYRYEHVDQNNALKNANAQTLRSRIGLQSGSFAGFSALIEADNVSRIGDMKYNSTRNRQGQYSVVTDPDGTEINQALLRYTHELGQATVGRQRINLDNQRFVGGVAWRQNEQTYDGALLALKPLDGLTLTYGYLDQVNSIFGPDGTNNFPNNPANIEGHSHLLNASYQLRPEATVTLYQYRLGLDNLQNGAQSSKTTGVRVAGKVQGWDYAAEYARQRDWADNPLNLSSKYYLVEAGTNFADLAVKAGYEVLGGDNRTGNRAFQTPLATKHSFQGWADVFLTTPAAGITDAWIGGSYPVLGGRLQAWYHDFRADKGSQRYGNEVNLGWGRAVPGVKGLQALVKYASYDSKQGNAVAGRTVDTDKLWLQLQYSL